MTFEQHRLGVAKAVSGEQSTNSPRAIPEESIEVVGNVRFSALSESIIRIERASHGLFFDGATLSVVERYVRPVNLRRRDKSGKVILETDKVQIEYSPSEDPLSDENISVTYKGDSRAPVELTISEILSSNLGGTIRTLDRCNGFTKIPKEGTPSEVCIEPGLLSKLGVSLFDDSHTPLLEGRWVQSPRSNVQDLYIFAYGRDYKGLLRDANVLFGPQPLPPSFAFGYWLSRYWSYTDQSYLELIDRVESEGVPLDVLVIDMDWHKQGWTGYSWEPSFFPDPQGFLDKVRERGIEVTLNVHPADGIFPHEDQYDEACRRLGVDPAQAQTLPFESTDPAFMDVYFNVLLRPLEKQGVRFWWLDWQQGSSSALEGVDPLAWMNHLHWQDWKMAHPEHRPLVFSRYGGVGAGRYPVGFSGDSYISWDSLSIQPMLTATAANVLFGYWSHDIGGHLPLDLKQADTGELLTRWVQLGTYSPILRTHSSKYVADYRFFWEYEQPFKRIMVDSITRRDELRPYIYTEARKCFDEGVSICRPLYYEDPESEESYHHDHEYFFGSEMVVAGITNPRDEATELSEIPVWLPGEGKWFDYARGLWLESRRRHSCCYLIEQYPCFLKEGAVLINKFSSSNGMSRDIRAEIFGGESGSYSVYEDDGTSNAYESGAFVRFSIAHRKIAGVRQIEIGNVSGDYAGFSETRNLELRLFDIAPPREVSVAGEVVPLLPFLEACRSKEKCWVTFDPNLCCVLINVPSISLQRGVSISVSESGSIEASGLRGVTALLRHAFESAIPLESQLERDLSELAFTSRRISAAPGRYAEECIRLRERLGPLLHDREALLRLVEQAERYRPRNKPCFDRSFRALQEIGASFPGWGSSE